MDAETGGGPIVIAAIFLPCRNDRLPFGFYYGGLQTIGRAGKVGGIENPLRKIFRKQAVRLAQNHRAFDGVFQLADVPGPGVAEETGFGLERDAGDAPPAADAEQRSRK